MSAFVTTPRLKLAAIVAAGAFAALPVTENARAQAPASQQAPSPQSAPPAAQPAPPAAQPPAPAANQAGAPTTPPPPAPPQPAASVQDAAKPAEGGKAMGTPAVVVDGGTADTLLGKPVESADGEDMGRVIDVVVDRDGTMRAAIIDFGGFLGVGSRKIAVDWRVLHFAKDDMERVVAELSRDRLKVAPVYKAGEPIVIVGRADAAIPPAPAPAGAAPAAQPASPNGASTAPPAAAAPPPPANTAPAPEPSAPNP